MLAKTYAERLNLAAQTVRSKITTRPDIGVVLGSGLGSYGEDIGSPIVIPYNEIPGMFLPSVQGHNGCLIFGEVGDRHVLCLSGRSHQYEGLHPHEIQFAIRLLIRCGCSMVVLTNAAGTRDPELNVGDLSPMLDHLNFTHRGYTEEPLVLKPFDHLIQTEMYDQGFLQCVNNVMNEFGIHTKGCAYTYNMGPTYETPSEVEGQFTLGCTNFGMSTVSEVIAAKNLGIPVLAMSFVTNKAAGVCDTPLTHAEVAKIAKEGEPRMKAIISTFIKRVQFKQIDIPEYVGDERPIARPRPSSFITEQEIEEVAKMFGTTKIDAGILLAGTHHFNFESVTSFSLKDLPNFPLFQYEQATMKIGKLAGKQIAVVDGITDLCGFEHHAQWYLVNLFNSLGAKVYIQTYASGTFGEKGPQLVKDVIPLFERPVKVPCACRILETSGLSVSPSAILATYHGPEFWSQKEAGSMQIMKATHCSLGSTIGLNIARSLGMKSCGIVDGSFESIIKSGTTTEQILEQSRSASPQVQSLVETVLSSIQSTPSTISNFTPNETKALLWANIPTVVLNKQEDPKEVDLLSAELPMVDAAIVFEEANPAYNQTVAMMQNQVVAHGHTLHVGVLKGKSVFVAVSTRLLIRACAHKKIHIIGVSNGLPTTDSIRQHKAVCFVDHMNVIGISPLLGHDQFKLRFPDMSHIYTEVKGLPSIKVFNLHQLGIATPSYEAAILNMGCQAVSQFGSIEATLARHSLGTYSHIAFLTEKPCMPWAFDPSVLELAL